MVQGCETLAALYVRIGMTPERSRIVETDWIGTAYAEKAKLLKPGQRFVSLSCRHYAVTANLREMTCPRCLEMIRHGFDYEAWITRRDIARDDLVWEADPARQRNEEAFEDDRDCTAANGRAG